jgi:hypothetical protein
MELLTRVDDQLLKDIGVSSAGHRPRLRDAPRSSASPWLSLPWRGSPRPR